MNRRRRRSAAHHISNANTHVNVLGQQLIRGLVLLDGVVIHAAGGERAAEEEAKEPVTTAESAQPNRKKPGTGTERG
jgi:hypothetical protein